MNTSEKLTGLGQFVVGAGASLVATTAMNPVFAISAQNMAKDAKKAESQASKPKGSFYANFLKSAKGFQPLVLDLMRMRGLKPNVLGVVPGQTTAFAANDMATKALTKVQGSDPSDLQKFFCGMFGGASSGFVTTGLERVRTYEQVKKVKTLEAFKMTFMQGPKTIFFGWQPVVIREMKFQGLFFGLQDYMKRYFRSRIVNQKRADAVANCTTGAASAFFSTPAERVRILMQMDPKSSETFSKTCVKVIKQEGLPGFFRGCGSRTVLGGGFLFFLGQAKDFLSKNMPSFFYQKDA